MVYLLNVVWCVLNLRSWQDSRWAGAVRHDVVCSLFLLTLSSLTLCLAAPNAESSAVVYSSTTSGKLYYCGPDARAGDDEDRFVAIAAVDLTGSMERADFIVPVHQHFTRHPFRWRAADGALFFLAGTIYPVRQDNFALHRIPLAELAKHRREDLRLPIRRDYADYSSYEKAWSRAVGAPTATGKVHPLGGPYAICRPSPIFGGFIRDGATKKFSYDFSLSPPAGVKCFTYSKGLLKESAANLTKIEAAAPRRAPELWGTVRSEEVEMEERFWVFDSVSVLYFATESGKLLNYSAPDEPRAVQTFSESPIVCVVHDADSGNVFAFCRQGYCELSDPAKVTVHELTVQHAHQDPVSLAARCAQILVDAGQVKIPPKKPIKDDTD